MNTLITEFKNPQYLSHFGEGSGCGDSHMVLDPCLEVHFAAFQLASLLSTGLKAPEGWATERVGGEGIGSFHLEARPEGGEVDELR